MKTSETNKLLKKHVGRWVYMVEHYGWKVTCYFYDSVEDMPDGVGEETAAVTNTKFKYLQAAIHFNVKKCSFLDEEEIEQVVIHELVHLLVSPLQESSETTPLEYTVTSIARVLQGLRKNTVIPKR